MRADQEHVAWTLIDPVLQAWSHTPSADFPNYSAGTWGPEAAEALIARDRAKLAFDAGRRALMAHSVRVFADKEAMSQAFVEHVSAMAAPMISPLKLALSGGSDPQAGL